jgi:hypothetical protein
MQELTEDDFIKPIAGQNIPSERQWIQVEKVDK